MSSSDNMWESAKEGGKNMYIKINLEMSICRGKGGNIIRDLMKSIVC